MSGQGGPPGGRLAGRRLLVVGGGQQTYGLPDAPVGIGRAVSVRGAAEGASVAVADLDPDAAARTVEQVRAEGGTGWPFTGDSSVEADVVRVLEEPRPR